MGVDQDREGVKNTFFALTIIKSYLLKKDFIPLRKIITLIKIRLVCGKG
jgi:hypothetical protein